MLGLVPPGEGSRGCGRRSQQMEQRLTLQRGASGASRPWALHVRSDRDGHGERARTAEGVEAQPIRYEREAEATGGFSLFRS